MSLAPASPALMTQARNRAISDPVHLIERALRSDRSAQEQLYRQYSRAMLRVALRITGSEAEAEDVLQEAFVRAFRSLHRFRGDATFGAWLKRIVVNTAINYTKRRRLDCITLDQARTDIAEEEPAPACHPDAIRKVRAAMERLPDGYRQVLHLYLVEGYDHQEIGTILHISEATSKSQFCRARRKLREMLEHETPIGYPGGMGWS
ncbi:MAG: sigma-70 family RNA polymerase sigma factor [Bacteroidia bacterium]|nr:sigma-70 family RNA polymerase sigma factor [Bacteroidia bacterium]